MNDIFAPQPVISVIIKDGWPVENSVGIVVGAPELADGVHELYAAPQLTPAAADVLAERHRQITVKGWTPEHDDTYIGFELAAAAISYIEPMEAENYWPADWHDDSFRPSDYRRNLVKATALLLAELERLDRQSQGEMK
ncbi:TPA: hypothetical protein ACIO7S_001459 [Salmonella enterica subsp. enterica serovar Birkenhead]